MKTKLLTILIMLIGLSLCAFAGVTVDNTLTVAAGSTAVTNSFTPLRGGFTLDHIALNNTGPVAATFVLYETAAGFDTQILSTNLSAGATVLLYPTRTTNEYYRIERAKIVATISAATNAVPIMYFMQSR